MSHMSGDGSDSFRDPMQGMFSEVARLLGSQSGEMNWELTQHVAMLIATDDTTTTNVDPTERIALESLTDIARRHVEQLTGTTFPHLDVVTQTRAEWTRDTLLDFRPILEALAQAVQPSGDLPSPSDDVEIPDSLEEIDFTAKPPTPQPDSSSPTSPLGQFEQFLVPIMLNIQAGGLVGNLSRTSLARFDIPVPRNSTQRICFLPTNIRAFSDAWSLPFDELNMYVVIDELIRTSVMRHDHVRDAFIRHIESYVRGFQLDTEELLGRFASLDVQNPMELPGAMMSSDDLFAVTQSPKQVVAREQLSALVAAFVGYVDYLSERICARINPGAAAIQEANKRRRVEDGKSNELVSQLFGIDLNQIQFDRGYAFVLGVTERAGDDALIRLWQHADELPTPAEVDAPGLWLARIGESPE